MQESELFSIGYQKAVEQLHEAITPDGFVASTTERDNYQRIWSRDGVIVTLSALLLDDDKLRQTALTTLRTLARHQGPHGEIPSNVDTKKKHISYGGTAGRVDANLWFLIGCHQYWRTTHDNTFLSEYLPSVRKVAFLLECWEFNTKGLLYIPETGDWADEYLQHGYVLYDQLLYWRALNGLRDIYNATNIDTSFLNEKIDHLSLLISTNYWFNNSCSPDRPGIYHPHMYEKGCSAAAERDTYWLPYFSPTGYGYRFDAMSNVLVSLFAIANQKQQETVDAYIEKKVASQRLKLLPAFSPVIDEIDEDWKELQATFSYTFKNKPYEYHNGGLWQLITGFYVVDLARRGKHELAKEYLLAIHKANRLDTDNKEWGFYEFINGKTFAPGGTRHLTWSAGAAIMGHFALQGKFAL